PARATRHLPSFPTRRSSDLKPTKFTVTGLDLQGTGKVHVFVTPWSSSTTLRGVSTYRRKRDSFEIWLYRTHSSNTPVSWLAVREDRKSTRLNSSHVSISYAV